MTVEAIDMLEKALHEKVDGLDRLISLAERNRQALIDHRTDDLEQINQLQTGELTRLDRHQRATAKLLAKVGASLGIEGERITITAVAAALPESPRQRLEELSSVLTQKAQELAEASDINAKLSQNALDFIRFTLQNLSEQLNETGAGNPASPGSLLLDAQV